MLGIGGRFSSSPGMVRVPDLSGRNLQQSVEILTNLKIPISQLSAAETQNPSLGGLLQSQSIAPGTLIDYGNIVIIRFFIYIAPPPPPPPPPPPTPVEPTPPAVTLVSITEGNCITTFSRSTTCSGTTAVTTDTSTGSRRDTYNYSDGTGTPVDVDCSVSSTTNVICGCPPSNCSAVVSSSNYIVNNSGCASGRAWYRRDFHPSCCSPSFSDSYGGCIPR